jgi:predicted nucleotidyltransferase
MEIEKIRRIMMELPKLVIEHAISIYLYGSTARGSTDEKSDCDIFVAINDCSDENYLLLLKSIENWHPEYKFEFAFYQMSTIKQMCEKGSYFLWHIKSEGKELYHSDYTFNELLKTLKPYNSTRNDFMEYSEILDDIAESLSIDETTIEYELAILATLVRNTCIGACYLMNILDFGRNTPILTCMEYWKDKFPFTFEEYSVLYEYRIYATRGARMYRQASLEYAKSWISKTRALLGLAYTL